MFMSRSLEKTPKTKFRKTQQEAKIVEKTKTLTNKAARVEPRGFDMWSDDEEVSDGC
jgi:hypothetical protein